MNILQALDDPHLFAPWFARGDWTAWRAFLATLFGLGLTPEQRDIFRACTRRALPPAAPFNEAALIIGRRGGKSFILAVLAVFLACFKDYRAYLQPGERACIMVIAADRRQARVIMRYIVGLLEGVAMLRTMIERQTTESIDLNNGVSIEVMTASFRTIRGYSVAAALLDELAFWRSDEGSANPDAEVIAALRPAMASIPGAMLFLASSPYARRGELHRTFQRYFAKEGSPVLVWRAATRVMNPTISERIIAEAYERDPASAAAEYGAEFRTDIESFVSREAVEACISSDVRERAPLSSQRYFGFVDPSGGSADPMTMAIGHREKTVLRDAVVVDAVREVKPPFSPESVVADFAALAKSYRVTRVEGDRYAGEWPREQFRKHGITYEPSAKPKSDLYRDLLPLINSRRIDLIDHDKLLSQLTSLERRTARGGRDSIDHPPGAHDDLANVIAGVACCTGLGGYMVNWENLTRW